MPLGLSCPVDLSGQVRPKLQQCGPAALRGGAVRFQAVCRPVAERVRVRAVRDSRLCRAGGGSRHSRMSASPRRTTEQLCQGWADWGGGGGLLLGTAPRWSRADGGGGGAGARGTQPAIVNAGRLTYVSDGTTGGRCTDMMWP